MRCRWWNIHIIEPYPYISIRSKMYLTKKPYQLDANVQNCFTTLPVADLQKFIWPAENLLVVLGHFWPWVIKRWLLPSPCTGVALTRLTMRIVSIYFWDVRVWLYLEKKWLPSQDEDTGGVSSSSLLSFECFQQMDILIRRWSEQPSNSILRIIMKSEPTANW